MIASRVVYPPNGGPLDESQPARATSPTGSPMASSPPTRIRTSGIFARRLSLTAASVANASSSLFGSSPPPANSGSIYQQSSFFRSSSLGINSAAASSSSINVSSSANNISSITTQSSGSGQAVGTASSSGRQRTRSTSHPPPPKYKSYRTPQLRISLQDIIGNLVLSAPVMAPGESIRGQIHLELPKATPVHSIEVCLTGTVTALDGTRLGSMKTVTILDECKTVATASITNTRTNTTRRHTTPSPSATASTATGVNAAAAGQDSTTTTTSTIATTTATSAATGQRGRRGSIVSVNSPTITDRATRSPTFPPSAGGIAAAISTAAAATIAAQGGNSRRLSTELMSRTLSMPSTYYSQGNNGSTLSLNTTNRPVSPTPAGLRGRRTSFSANVDAPLIGGASFNALLASGGRGNMSMVNISTLSQFPLDDVPDPSEPEAPSYDPPNYDGIFTSTSARSSTEEASSMTTGDVTSAEVVSAPVTSSSTIEERSSSEEASSTLVSTSLAATTITDEDTTETPVSAPISAPMSTPSPSNSTDDVRSHSSRSSGDGGSDPTPTSTSATTTTTTPATPAEPAEPKAVLMQPGNYVIPFSIRIPSNSTMSLPGSFTDPVGNISYQLKAVMKQILPSPDPYNPRALVVEPTFTSSTQIIKLIPMNDPAYMPLYNMPFETESVRANVGAWVWSTGFLEAHAWVPRQGYRPGRIVPLVIHIVNHSDARQVVVETTLCKCLHYGSGLSSARAALGIAGQGYLMDSSVVASPNGVDGVEEGGAMSPVMSAFAEGHGPILEDATSNAATTTTDRERRRRSGRRSSSNRNSRQSQQPPSTSVMPSPPASPYGSTFPSTPTSEQGGESPEGSVHGVTAGTSIASTVAAAAARIASPNSMASISSQQGSIHSNSSDGNSNSTVSGGASGGGGHVAAAIQAYNNMGNTTINSSGGIQYNPDTLRSSMTSPAPSTKTITIKESSGAAALPIIQHQREKLTKSKTLINCSHAVDREIQKTIPVLIPPTAGYSILNAPLLEVSYEIVIKIRAEKTPNTVVPVPRRRQNGVRLSVPIVVVVPEDGDLEDEDEELLLATHGISAVLGNGAGNNMSSLGLAMGTTFSGIGGLEDDFEFGDQGECPPYEVTASSSSRRRSRR